MKKSAFHYSPLPIPLHTDVIRLPADKTPKADLFFGSPDCKSHCPPPKRKGGFKIHPAAKKNWQRLSSATRQRIQAGISRYRTESGKPFVVRLLSVKL